MRKEKANFPQDPSAKYALDLLLEHVDVTFILSPSLAVLLHERLTKICQDLGLPPSSLRTNTTTGSGLPVVTKISSLAKAVHALTDSKKDVTNSHPPASKMQGPKTSHGLSPKMSSLAAALAAEKNRPPSTPFNENGSPSAPSVTAPVTINRHTQPYSFHNMDGQGKWTSPSLMPPGAASTLSEHPTMYAVPCTSNLSSGGGAPTHNVPWLNPEPCGPKRQRGCETKVGSIDWDDL